MSESASRQLVESGDEGTVASRERPVDEGLPEEDLLEEDLLIEDVSIDGMCGVY